jgi:hypothetical protein
MRRSGAILFLSCVDGKDPSHVQVNSTFIHDKAKSKKEFPSGERRMPIMKAIPLPMQLRLVAASYALVLATAIMLVYARHLQYVNNAADAAAAGGMYADGDLILEIFIGCMFLAPTLLLVLVIRNSENLYTGYSKVLLGLSLTAPISLGLISIPAVGQGTMLLGWICMDRLFASPIIFAGLLVSRLLAQFDRAKRLTMYALLIEVATLGLTLALFLLPAIRHRG